MSLRRRLVAAFTLLLLLSLAALAVVATHSTERVLLAQADNELRAIETRFVERPGPVTRDQGSSLTGRRFALIRLEDGGSVVETIASGFADAPDPLPDLDGLSEMSGDPGTIHTVGSVDGSISYRAVAIVGSDGSTDVVAVRIDDIDDATNDLTAWLLLGGLVVGIAGAGATWLIVRRGLRPVDAMVDTAAAIAGGDLARRVPDTKTTTELGRLGAALNDMLSQLDQAFSHERIAQQRLNQFIADASHELRTPLAALQGYVHLYRTGALDDPAELAAAMARIRRESNRMQRLVDDLLLLARLDQGQTFTTVEVDLAAVLSDTIENSHAIEPERTVTYSGPQRLMVAGDESRLVQVFANLVTNARTHTPAGSPVQISATRHDDTIRIDVVDSGTGIPDAQLDRVFDRFRQLEPSTATATAGGGAGLGLAIVAAIVDAHRGTVTASNTVAGGACFTVVLPCS